MGYEKNSLKKEAVFILTFYYKESLFFYFFKTSSYKLLP